MQLFAYIGPETFLPIASAVAAFFGWLLMIGKSPFRIFGWLYKTVTGKNNADAPINRAEIQEDTGDSE